MIPRSHPTLLTILWSIVSEQKQERNSVDRLEERANMPRQSNVLRLLILEN